jgi:heptosyltransferase-1
MRILIVKLSSIGDVVHALPAAALIRRVLPDAHISWVVERRAGAILKDSAAIDELVEIDTRAWRRHMLSASTLDEIRARLGRLRGPRRAAGGAGVDVAIDFQGLLKSGLVAKASGATRRIGFETAGLREKASRFFLTEQVETAGFPHVIDKNLALARRAITNATADPTVNSNGRGDRYEFPITVSPEDERHVERAISERGGGRFAIINPGGGWPTKLWPAGAYGQVADSLHARAGVVHHLWAGRRGARAGRLGRLALGGGRAARLDAQTIRGARPAR